MRAVLLALPVLLLAQDPAGVPEPVRRELSRFLPAWKSAAYFPAKRYDDLKARVEKASDLEAAAAVLRDLAQLAFDHDAGREWCVSLDAALKTAGARDLAAAAFPAEVELEKLTFKGGLVLLGTGGPLSRRWPNVKAELLLGQRYLEPNLGMDGRGNFWIAPADLQKQERVKVPLPKAFLAAIYGESVDDQGRLVIDGDWLRPGTGRGRESIALTARDIRNGGALFVNEELGIQSVRPTDLLRRHADALEIPAELREEMGWVDPPATAVSPTPELSALKATVEALRAKAPDVPWFEPFDPDPALGKAAEGRADLVDADPDLSLLRLRFAVTYGADLPELAIKDPRAMLILEKAVLAALLSGKADDVEKLGHDWRTVAAACRHARSFEAPPKPGLEDNVWVRFPKSYTPWRTWPLLVALHGQGCQPQWEYDAWGDLADAAGMILICPRYGSTGGTSHARASDEEILSVVRRFRLAWPVDPDRVYLTGVSMGGSASWHLAQSYPGLWAAFAPEIHGPIRFDKKFPLLRNVRRVPLYQLEGQFDGLNTIDAREAAQELQRLGGTVEFRESGLVGHDRSAFRYPAVLRFFSSQRREPHPTEIEHRAFNAFKGSHAWLAVTGVARSSAFHREDGAINFAELLGLKASLKKDEIRIDKVSGKPSEAVLYWDPAIMPGKLVVRTPRKRLDWTPEPSVRTLIETAAATGDRARAYPARMTIAIE